MQKLLNALFYVLLLIAIAFSAAALRAQETAETESPAADTGEESSSDDSKPEADAAPASGADDATTAANDSAADAADDADAAADDEKPAKANKKRKTHTVESDSFRVTVELSGLFVAREMTEVALRPEAWSDFKVTEAVEHGAEVHEGEVLVEFDDRKINQAIEALEIDMHLSELAIRKAEQELPRVEKSLAMAVEEAQRRHAQARQDYERYKELEQAFYEKMVNYTVKDSEYDLSYAVEELEQLEKMYEADDLTEETEEIVLRRQRNTVEMAEFMLEDAEFYRDGILQITLPRMESRMQEAVDASELTLERARMAQTIDVNRARYELEKMKQQRAKSQERHAKLLGDRALMKLESPTAGLVYFGRCTQGRWADTASMMAKLRPFGSASANSVLMTIVQPRPLYVLATVSEKDRPSIEPGQSARVSPPPKHSEKLAAEVATVSVAPVASAKFRVELKLDEQNGPAWLVPGMSCDVEVTTYEQESAITIPEDALHTDEDNDEEHYVWLVDADDDEATPGRHTVEVGQRHDKRVEIVDGLADGDVISLEDEEDEESDD